MRLIQPVFLTLILTISLVTKTIAQSSNSECPSDFGIEYASTSPDDCLDMRISCSSGLQGFFDANCGCGCKPRPCGNDSDCPDGSACVDNPDGDDGICQKQDSNDDKTDKPTTSPTKPKDDKTNKPTPSPTKSKDDKTNKPTLSPTKSKKLTEDPTYIPTYEPTFAPTEEEEEEEQNSTAPPTGSPISAPTVDFKPESSSTEIVILLDPTNFVILNKEIKEYDTADGPVFLEQKDTGELALYRGTRQNPLYVIWTNGVSESTAKYYTRLGPKGNLVTRIRSDEDKGELIWSTDTAGEANANYYFVLNADESVSILHSLPPNHEIIWTSDPLSSAPAGTTPGKPTTTPIDATSSPSGSADTPTSPTSPTQTNQTFSPTMSPSDLSATASPSAGSQVPDSPTPDPTGSTTPHPTGSTTPHPTGRIVTMSDSISGIRMTLNDITLSANRRLMQHREQQQNEVLGDDDVEVFENATALFTMKFFKNSPNITYIKSAVTVTDQQVTESNDGIIITYTQDIEYGTDNPKISPEMVVVVPFATEDRMEEYVAFLQKVGKVSVSNTYDSVTSASVEHPESDVPDDSDSGGLTTGVTIGIIVGCVGVLLLIAGSGFLYAKTKASDKYTHEAPVKPPANDETKNEKPLVPMATFNFDEGQDDISTLEDPNPVSKVDKKDETDLSAIQEHSIASIEFGNSDNGEVSGGGVGASGATLESGDIYLDSSADRLIVVNAPPGKLGVILDTPDDGPPVVHAVKESSPIFDELFVGDAVQAIDDQDVRSMTAVQISELIGSKADCARKISVIRTFSK